jgi:hypothetical protein
MRLRGGFFSEFPLFEKLPTFSVDLIAELDKAIRHECIRPGESIEDAHRRAGKRELIDSLLLARERKDENILKD